MKASRGSQDSTDVCQQGVRIGDLARMWVASAYLPTTLESLKWAIDSLNLRMKYPCLSSTSLIDIHAHIMSISSKWRRYVMWKHACLACICMFSMSTNRYHPTTWELQRLEPMKILCVHSESSIKYWSSPEWRFGIFAPNNCSKHDEQTRIVVGNVLVRSRRGS